ncbi:hypothetical protein [Alkaliphilus hydrothermalis]|uniref:Uncharacterized protein n=1 Tax=Alkaliphilus hydrothermalis TaxID=1482730 RepID=A0ABS2NQJ5_9FIRM|nr:hypothetical protein [Alkaliphilus hydrothermalis]MBM7615233.1 hypothetical protein [Alkaliphilus hydrothermalis]
MGGIFYQIINLIIVISIIGIPILLTILFLKRYGTKSDQLNSLDVLLTKINELENRIEILEEKLDAIDID